METFEITPVGSTRSITVRVGSVVMVRLSGNPNAVRVTVMTVDVIEHDELGEEIVIGWNDGNQSENLFGMWPSTYASNITALVTA
jgi:hypothetical protein